MIPKITKVHLVNPGQVRSAFPEFHIICLLPKAITSIILKLTIAISHHGIK
jgi:hypothetical protein